ncbi:Zn-dependent hydrolase [Halococcus agarilyticus]|uniref:Zn-dependent hydrolase n=1 Tax=Halococcus agarilyticus TaxID=1232219 RepID=UPI000677A570|nr:Zn-dependent hydrolase [Halococcus agarilyticus]
MVTIDAERFRDSFETYSAIGATEQGGLHRLALTDADRKARDRFVADLREIGLDVRIDAIGNVFARRDGTNADAAPVLIGSHLDTQPRGGRFDGQLGVLAALETLRTLEEEDIETERPIEIVDWTNEEGSRFQHAMLGSAVFVGELGLETALAMTDADGTRLGDALERIGYDGEHPVRSHDHHAYLELHVEQGPKLAEHGASVGVVDGVFGIRWLEATIHGETDHAGPTPMHARHDAVATAADAVSEINALPNRLSTDAVTTVGRIRAEPDSINVVPDRAEFTIDVRSADDDVVQTAAERVAAELAAACERHRTTYELDTVWETSVTEFAPELREAVGDAAATLDVAHERVVSGAGHDAKYLSRIMPAGMVFVPSVGGTTHNEAEFTEWDDCVAGANVYANAALSLAGDV